MERPYQRPVTGPREVCTPHHPRGGGADASGARAHKHAEGTRGLPDWETGATSRNAQTGWNGVPVSEGKGHLDWTARHTQRGTRGVGRGKRERHTTRYRPEPPEPAASAAHTRTGHPTRQGSSGAPQPLGKAASAPAQGGPTGDKPVARARRRRRPGRPRIKGATRWVSARSHGCQIDALTGEWRNGEAGEGRGSEPCEPGGLRHQAGGASWRALH